MRVKILLIAMLSALFSLSVIPTHAADAVVGTGSAGSCTESTLQAAVTAVNSAGGTITFNCGGAHTITFTQQLRFDQPNRVYTLDGGGLITLNGNDQTRLIYTASGKKLTLTVRDLTLTHGRAAFDAENERAANQGGAIYSGYENTLIIEDVEFLDNSALAERHLYHGGGALAIDTTSHVTITDSVFDGNTAPNGGAINNLLSVLTIERSTFTLNESTSSDPGGGGAIYNDAGKLTILSSHILDNTAANLGGGIFSWAHNVNGAYSGKTVIRDTVIDGNSAEHGGGLWKGGHYVLELTRSSVTNNSALERGGGISGTGPGKNFAIVNSTIAYNTVQNTGSAAGIFSANASSTIKNSTIAFNTVPSDPSSVGAAIHGDVTLTNTVLLGNTGGWNGIWACMGNITNGGHNLQSPGDTCGGGIPTRDAHLTAILTPARASLTLGQTQTLAPELDSPAINKGADCPSTDQRKVARPQGKTCDIGAYELEVVPLIAPAIISPTEGATGIARQPVITWTHSLGAVKYKLTLKKSNGDVFYTTTRTADSFGCAPTCTFSLSSANKTLAANKPYTLTIQAINPFYKRPSTVSFRTTP